MARAGEILGRLGADLVRAGRVGWARLALPRGRFWLRLRLASPVPELGISSWLGSQPRTLSVLEVLRVLEVASRDSRVAGVLLRLDGSPGGFARIASLRRALAGFRGAGKPLIAWSERYGAQELWLASAAERVLLPPSGSVMLVGLRLEGVYLRDLLQHIGVRPVVLRSGAWKSAGEALTRAAMSPEQREQLDALLDDVFGTLVADVAASRGLEPDALRALVDRGPFTAPAAREAGLVDACCYPDEVEALLVQRAPEASREGRPVLVDASAYAGLRALDPGWRPLHRALPRVAYVVARGSIRPGQSPVGVSSEPYRRLLARLAESDAVLGVILRVDSPGGEVVASDLLGRAVTKLAERKPVVVSMGDVAASGGYLMSVGAQALFAESGAITGSIGVVAGKLDLSALYERIGVHKDAVERGARAGLLSEGRGLTADERSALHGGIDALYEHFLERVAEGRGLARSEVDRLGRGRIWSGRRAHVHGLVDGLGGPLEALDEVRRRAGIALGERFLLDVHPRLPWLARWLRQARPLG